MSKQKLTYEMKSPGEAWMDHVNNDMNAKAVTPAYLDPEVARDKQKEAALKGMDQTQKQVTEQNKQKDVSKDLDR